MANETVGIDIVARLDQFRAELAKIPDIGGKEAKALVGQLSREIKNAEKASRSAAAAAKDHGFAIKGMTAAVFKAELGMEALKKGLDLAGKAIGALVSRAAEIDPVAGAALRQMDEATQGLTDTLASGLAPQIASAATLLADLAAGASLAAQALFGLDQQQRSMLVAQEQARESINAQAEAVSALRVEIERSATIDLLTSATGEASAATQALTADLERELNVLRRLKGELAGTAGIGARPATPGATPTPRGAPAASSSSAASGPRPEDFERIAPVVQGANEQLAEFRRLIDEVAAASMAETEQIRADAETQVEAIKAALAEYVLGTETSQGERLRAIQTAREAEIEIEAHAAEQIAGVNQRTHDARMSQIEREKEAAQQAANASFQAAFASGMAIADLAGTVADAVATAKGKESAAAREAAETAWAIQSAVAIAQAAINIPLAISNAFTSGSQVNAIFGAVMAVAAGVTAGAAFAGVVAKAAAGPQFHSGGVFGADEGPAVLRRGEGILTPSAVAQVGGADGVAALNRGGGGGEQVVVLKLGHKVADMQTTQSLDRRRGPLYEAIRQTQPRTGLHRARV